MKKIFKYYQIVKFITSIIKYLIKNDKKKNEVKEKHNIPKSYGLINERIFSPNSFFADKMVFIDWGHGGIDPDGRYTTKGKLYDHGKGNFHNSSVFYEGVFNRDQGIRLAKKLLEKHIPFMFVAHKYEDTSLKKRVDVANRIAWQLGKQNCLYISLHANAFNSRARGFSVHTSPGVTKSDKIAENYFNRVANKMGHLINLRFDKSDGDHDYENRFWVLTKTIMPAILIEHLFFDNFEDANMLMDEKICDKFAEQLSLTIQDWYTA